MLVLSPIGTDTSEYLFGPSPESGGYVTIIPHMLLGRRRPLISVGSCLWVAGFELLHDLIEGGVLDSGEKPWSAVKEGLQ